MNVRGPVLALCALVPACAAVDYFDAELDPVEPAALLHAKTLSDAPDPAGAITVVDWNIKFGGGRLDFFFDCHGNRGNMDKAEVHDNLAGVAAEITSLAPDILFVEEVDRPSKRSAYVDELQWLLDHTHLNFAAYASQWKADFVPSDGIGRIDDGIAVLSRWPISHAQRIALPEVGEYDALERYFYLKRGMLIAQVAVPGMPDGLWVVVVHTEAYSHDGTKARQIDRFAAELDALDRDGKRFVAGGDLNALPPGSQKTSDFPDLVCTDQAFRDDDYAAETTLLQPLYDAWEAEIPLADYQADNARYFSHTTDKDAFWNRKLDYLFTNGDFVDGSGEVHQQGTMPLSDHAPVSVELVVP